MCSLRCSASLKSAPLSFLFYNLLHASPRCQQQQYRMFYICPTPPTITFNNTVLRFNHTVLRFNSSTAGPSISVLQYYDHEYIDTLPSQQEINRRQFPPSLKTLNASAVWNSLIKSCSSTSVSLPKTSFHHPPTRPAAILLAAFFGLFSRDSDEDDPTKVPPSVKRQLLRAQRHRRNGNYAGAERACHRALQILATSSHSASQAYVNGRAYVLDVLANIYLEQGKLDKAEANFKETMAIMLSAGIEQESEAITEISLKLAKIYTNQKKYELAGVGFQWCADKARQKWKQTQSPESHALLGMCLHSMGQYYLAVGNGAEASIAFIEALDIARQVYGDEDLQVAVMLNDLGTALDSQGQFSEAEKSVMESLDVAKLNKDVAGIEEYLAIIQCNLAEILDHQGKEKDASETCVRAVAAAKRTKDKLFYETIRKRCFSRNNY